MNTAKRKKKHVMDVFAYILHVSAKMLSNVNSFKLFGDSRPNAICQPKHTVWRSATILKYTHYHFTLCHPFRTFALHFAVFSVGSVRFLRSPASYYFSHNFTLVSLITIVSHSIHSRCTQQFPGDETEWKESLTIHLCWRRKWRAECGAEVRCSLTSL